MTLDTSEGRATLDVPMVGPGWSFSRRSAETAWTTFEQVTEIYSHLQPEQMHKTVNRISIEMN